MTIPQSSSHAISHQEYNLFHNIDRKLYGLLVLDLWRNPMEAVQFLALWLWLERVRFGLVVKKILSLSLVLINGLADEASLCLEIIRSDRVSASSDLADDTPLMQNMIHVKLCPLFFAQHRLIAIGGLKIIVNDVCMRVLPDIMQVAIERNVAYNLADPAQKKQLMVLQQAQQKKQQQQTQMQVQQPIVQPGLHRAVGCGGPVYRRGTPIDPNRQS